MFPMYAALAVIDVQQGFLDLSWNPRGNPNADVNIACLISALRLDGQPIRHIHHASRSSAGSFYKGAPGYEPKSQAVPASGEPIHPKSVNNRFISTTLEQDLKTEGTDTLVVRRPTNHCVSPMVRMAGNFDFVGFVVENATAAFDRAGLDRLMRPAADVHAAALGNLADEYAPTVRTDVVLQALGTPESAAALEVA